MAIQHAVISADDLMDPIRGPRASDAGSGSVGS